MTLLQSEMFAVALMVFVPTLFLPGLYLLTLLFVLWLTGRGDVPAGVQNRLVRMMQQVYPWSMVEVFLLGVLVAIIKLSSMASIIAGPALWAWMGTTITLTVVLTFRLRRLIRRTHMPVGEVRLQDDQVVYAGQPPVLEEADGEWKTAVGRHRDAHDGALLTAAESARFCGRRLGMISCRHCDTVWAEAREGERCRHCDARLHRRKPGGLGVTWALLITAMILYVPANLLPVMTTSTLFGTDDSTILSGVIYFWQDGEWALAAIIFIASFLIPLFKLVALILLALLVQFRSLWRLQERTHLYDIVEWVDAGRVRGGGDQLAGAGAGRGGGQGRSGHCCLRGGGGADDAGHDEFRCATGLGCAFPARAAARPQAQAREPGRGFGACGIEQSVPALGGRHGVDKG